MSKMSTNSGYHSPNGEVEIEKEGLLPQGTQDVEKGHVPPPALPVGDEHSVSARKKLIALAGYFFCNVGLTIYNKAVLGPVRTPSQSWETL